MKLPIAHLPPRETLRRRKVAEHECTAAFVPHDVPDAPMAGDPIRDCELACHRAYPRGSPELASCLSNCR
jgi:hypothetical protein